MKATGIVRRVDDLGRIVIPKEIRRTLKIREGDPLEIHTPTGSGLLSVGEFSYLCLPRKKIAMVPGPAWAPITAPM